MRGAILTHANLTGGDLRNAKLSGAGVEATIVAHTNFTGAHFGSAIWIDGVPCKPGSVGSSPR